MYIAILENYYITNSKNLATLVGVSGKKRVPPLSPAGPDRSDVIPT